MKKLYFLIILTTIVADTIGQSNTSYGTGAGNGQSPAGNSCFGYYAGDNVTFISNFSGVSNSIFGCQAGQNLYSGADNCFFGLGAGKSNISGNKNIFI